MVSEDGAIDSGLKAISDSTRRGILSLLKRRQMSVLEIAEEFPMSRPAISKHLRILKEAGLVLETPAGRQRLYELERGPLEVLSAWLAGLNGGHDRRGYPRAVRMSSTSARVGSRTPQARSAPGDWRVW